VRGFEGRPAEVVEEVLLAGAGALVHSLALAEGNVFAFHATLRSGELFTGGAIARTAG
jgi:hypothetical protein